MIRSYFLFVVFSLLMTPAGAQSVWCPDNGDGYYWIMNPQESDEFNDGILGKQWQWHANYHQFYGMPTADGTMRLYTNDLPEDYVSIWQMPNLLLQKPAAPRFTATAKVRFASKEDDQYGGIVMMGRNYSALVIYRQGDKFLLQRHTCIGADEGRTEQQQTLATLQPTDCDTIRVNV